MVAMYEHLLVATDFSEQAAGAVALAGLFAKRCAAALTVASVFDANPHSPLAIPTASEQFLLRLEVAVKERLAKIRREELAEVEAVDCEALRDAHAADALVELARQRGTDLCIVGTHGRMGIARMLLGSVAERVVRFAPCDVLVSRGDTRLPTKVLAATDMSPESMVAVDRAGQFAATLSCTVELLHVHDPSVPVPAPGGGLEHPDTSKARVWEKLTAVRTERLPDVDATTEVVNDAHAAGAICAHAEKIGADLVIVATRGRGGLSRLMIGSVAERVVRHAHCPVLVVRAAEQG